MVKLIITCGLAGKLQKFYDNYEDDKVKMGVGERKGVKLYYNVETEMEPTVCEAYVKNLFAKSPEGPAITFSCRAEGYFG